VSRSPRGASTQTAFQAVRAIGLARNAMVKTEHAVSPQQVRRDFVRVLWYGYDGSELPARCQHASGITQPASVHH
jgi:hypothetical protein